MAETKFIREKKEMNYTVLDNTFIKDCELSWKAKGVMTYLLSLPQDWEIYLTELEKHSSDGRDALKSAIKELEEKGYIEKQKKTDKGKFAGYSYTIHEVPVNHCGKTATEKPSTENPSTENPQLLNTNNTKYLNIQNTNNTNSEETTKRFQKPTIEEIKAYCEERKNNVNADRFYDYYESKGWVVGKAKMKDWKACVRTWEKNSFSNNTQEKKFTVIKENNYQMTEEEKADIPF